jgi:hypothetical protein
MVTMTIILMTITMTKMLIMMIPRMMIILIMKMAVANTFEASEVSMLSSTASSNLGLTVFGRTEF